MNLLPRANSRPFVIVVHPARVRDMGFVALLLERLINHLPTGAVEVFDYAGTRDDGWVDPVTGQSAADTKKQHLTETLTVSDYAPEATS